MTALARAFSDHELSERIARAAVLAMESDGDSPAVRRARRRLAEISRAERNILRAVEAGVVPPGTDRRLAELAGERAALEREVEAAATAVPTVGEMAEWVRTRLCRRDPDALLRHAASRATIDDRGVLRVEIPWRASENLLKRASPRHKKSANAQLRGSSPNSSLVARTRFELVISALRGRRPEPLDERAVGSPYQIRTGDLRLERAAS